MKRKLWLAFPAAIMLAFATPSCQQFQQAIEPAPQVAQIAAADSSQIVVYAEKTLRISKDTFDLFLKLEFDNQALVKSKLPQVHTFAEYVRRNQYDWLNRANNVKNLYKHNRTAVNKANLVNALDVLTKNTETAQRYIDELKAR